jgi:2,6-dihydroxypyridine 3-monooxygenase
MGGSLGGLTAGLVLRDLGCDVHVFERSRSPLQERGAGICILDITIRWLAEHGAVDPAEICTPTAFVRYLHADGSVQYEEPRRYRFSSWNTIYRTLGEALGEKRYHLSGEITGFDQDADGVTVRFAGGTEGRFDLLVCADGIASPARSQLCPGIEPGYAGYVAWRGTVPEDRLTAATSGRLADAITYQLVPASHILIYPIPSLAGSVERGQRLLNFVWYRNVAEGDELDWFLTDRHGERRATSLPPGAARDGCVDEIRSFAAEYLAPPIAEVVARTTSPFVQVILDLEVPAMAFGRVCLLGDAAFSARPHAAAGSAKAAANAWALAEALAETDGDVPKALARWEPAQLELGRNLVERARDIGRRSQFDGTWVPGDPTLVFGLYGPGR